MAVSALLRRRAYAQFTVAALVLALSLMSGCALGRSAGPEPVERTAEGAGLVVYLVLVPPASVGETGTIDVEIRNETQAEIRFSGPDLTVFDASVLDENDVSVWNSTLQYFQDIAAPGLEIEAPGSIPGGIVTPLGPGETLSLATHLVLEKAGKMTLLSSVGRDDNYLEIEPIEFEVAER